LPWLKELKKNLLQRFSFGQSHKKKALGKKEGISSRLFIKKQ
jgi:hypothetical protein